MSNENVLQTLTAEEATQLQADINAATQNVVTKRENAQLQTKIDNYRREMLANRGKGKAHVLRQIKEHARAQGVPVDSIDFS